PGQAPEPAPEEPPASPVGPHRPDDGDADAHVVIIAVAGSIPPEQWNRLGTRLIPKMRAAGTVTANIRLEIEVDQAKSTTLTSEFRQIVDETGLSATVHVASAPNTGG